MSTEGLIIKVRFGAPIVVSGERVGPFLIHRSVDAYLPRWTVTHVVSTCRVASFRSSGKARNVARLLAHVEGADWSKDWQHCEGDTWPAEVRERCFEIIRGKPTPIVEEPAPK